MKKAIIISFICSLAMARAAVVDFDISPPGTDFAVGLSPLNEVPPPTNSIGTGNEIGSGITFDTTTLTLSLSLGYGSAFGFTNLTGAATAADIDGPAPTNMTAGIVISLDSFNTLATNPVTGGSIVASIVLTTNQAADLLAGLYYINISTAANTNGEIRGQLIPFNTEPTLVCPGPTNVECAGTNGTLATLTAQVSDDDGDPLSVVWNVNGTDMQTNSVSGSTTNVTSVTFSAMFQHGTNDVMITVSDGFGTNVTCSTTVNVEDTNPPTILSVTSNPSILWPPNHQLVPVVFTVMDTDTCGTVSCKISSITSNEHKHHHGSSMDSDDWVITGDLTAELRAERSGHEKCGRIYTITIECTDESGNTSSTNVIVKVPHDQGHHEGDDDDDNGGNGNGEGEGNGNGGHGHGHDNGNSNGNGNGHGHDNGKGNGNANNHSHGHGNGDDNSQGDN